MQQSYINPNDIESYNFFSGHYIILLQDDNNIPAIGRNLKKARCTCGRVSKNSPCQEVHAPVPVMFYQTVVAAVLLYGSKSSNLPPSGTWVLEGFRVEAVRLLMGMYSQQRIVGP